MANAIFSPPYEQESVMVTEYVPEAKFSIDNVVAPLDQLTVTSPSSPSISRVIVPVPSPLVQ